VHFKVAFSKPELDRGETEATNVIAPATFAALVALTLLPVRRFDYVAHSNP
jgi:hypothetical protein